MPRDFRAFLRMSLAEIERSEPDADHALRAALADLRAGLSKDAARFAISCDDAGWRFSDNCAGADVEVAFDDEIIEALVEGEMTLNDAIADERLRISGSVDSVARFYEALFIYLEGLVRAPAMPRLWERYRAS